MFHRFGNDVAVFRFGLLIVLFGFLSAGWTAVSAMIDETIPTIRESAEVGATRPTMTIPLETTTTSTTTSTTIPVTTTTTTIPKPVGRALIISLMNEYDMPDVMLRVAYCESVKATGAGWRDYDHSGWETASTIVSPTHDYGYWQINRSAWRRAVEKEWPDMSFEESMKIPERNAQWANVLLRPDRRGITNWGTSSTSWGSWRCWNGYQT